VTITTIVDQSIGMSVRLSVAVTVAVVDVELVGGTPCTRSTLSGKRKLNMRSWRFRPLSLVAMLMTGTGT